MPEPIARSEASEPPSRASLELGRRAADDALRALREAPPLAVLGLAAAFFELALARVGWHGLSEVVTGDTLRELRRLAHFPRNLAAVAGLVALTVALVGFLRFPGFASIPRRLAVAGFSGVLLPAIAVATYLPPEALRRKLVIFGLAAANVLVTLVAMSSWRYRAGPSVRVAMVSAGVTCFLTLAMVGLGQLGETDVDGPLGSLGTLFNENRGTAERVLMGTRHFAELAWLLTPLAAGGAVLAHGDRKTVMRRLAAMLVASAACIAGILAYRELVGHRFRLVLFGAFRLGLVVDDAPALYALPLGATLGAGLVALGHARAAVRQLGLGMLLWLCAGFAPHTPIQLLYLVLGALLLARAAQALDPEGEWRAHHPWARFLPR